MRNVFVPALVSIGLLAACSLTDVAGGDEFGCDKTAEAVNPTCSDFEFGAGTNPDASKDACTGQGGKVIDACPHGLGGCKMVKTALTGGTTWYFADETTKTVEDVKKKCADTGSSFVDP